MVKLKENYNDKIKIQNKFTFMLENPSNDESSSTYYSIDE